MQMLQEANGENADPIQDVIAHIVETASSACESPEFDAYWCAFVHLWHNDPLTWDTELPEFSRVVLRNKIDERFKC